MEGMYDCMRGKVSRWITTKLNVCVSEISECLLS